MVHPTKRNDKPHSIYKTLGRGVHSGEIFDNVNLIYAQEATLDFLSLKNVKNFGLW